MFTCKARLFANSAKMHSFYNHLNVLQTTRYLCNRMKIG